MSTPFPTIQNRQKKTRIRVLGAAVQGALTPTTGLQAQVGPEPHVCSVAPPGTSLASPSPVLVAQL